MNEEMNRREAELNEAALTGVSGGGNGSAALGAALKVCLGCSCIAKCSHREKGLAEYLQNNGIDSVTSTALCPFIKEAMKA